VVRSAGIAGMGVVSSSIWTGILDMGLSVRILLAVGTECR
jgi:hypothetical protein